MPISHSGDSPAKKTARKPVICITAGDPRGIGPEVIEKALKSPALKGKANFLIIENKDIDIKDPYACARASVGFIDDAFELIKCKKADALVTGPVNKKDINEAGIKFEGHTEYLAKLSGCDKFAMMFVSGRLNVSIVTRHIAVKDISAALSAENIFNTVELTYGALKNLFGFKNPKVGVSGLNPHSGESGLFGKEEKTIIIPAIKRLQNRFKGILGPIPADTLLYDAYNGKYDAAVCMYHDQGLAAFKMIARESGVNVTLGLPFVRTSVDHGTGFDIAQKGKADPGSMIEAIKLSINLFGKC